MLFIAKYITSRRNEFSYERTAIVRFAVFFRNTRICYGLQHFSR